MKQEQDRDRRSFLKTLLAGSAVTAIAAANGTAADARAAARPAGTAPSGGKTDILYQETEEFKHYYASLRS